MLGLLANFIDDLGQYLVRGLAVAGGAAVGAVVTGLVAGFVIRRVFHKPQPPGVRALFRVLGGVAGGLAVALLVFTGLGGKWGFGGGGDGGQSKGELGPTRTSATQPDAPRATE